MGRVHTQNRQAAEELVKKRGLIILGVVVLLGAWFMVIGYEFLEKENALLQKRVKAAKEDSSAARRETRSTGTMTSSVPASGCRIRQTFRWSAGCGSSTRCARA